MEKYCFNRETKMEATLRDEESDSNIQKKDDLVLETEKPKEKKKR